MSTAAVVITVMIVACGAAKTGLDAGSLTPERNLLSNCSFEAVAKGKPLAWALYAQPQFFSMTDDALHGEKALMADAPSPASEQIRHTAARQGVEVKDQTDYVLSAWLKVLRTDGKDIRIYLEFLDAKGKRLAISSAKWEGQQDEWTRLEVKARAPLGTAEARALVPYLYGGACVVVDAVRLAPASGKIERPAATVSDLHLLLARPTDLRVAWQSDAHRFVVQWRAVGLRAHPWRDSPPVREQRYTVLGLKPAQKYQLRVRTIPRELINEKGKTVVVGQPVVSEPIAATTQPWQPRRWAGLKLWPTVHVPTFPDGTVYPSIEIYDDHLYLLEVRNGELYLSRLPLWDGKSPVVPKPDWTRLVIEQAPGCYQGLTDTVIYDGKLWISWNRQATSKPDYEITQSRQLLTWWDLATDERGPIVTVEPTRPGYGTWEGGLAVLEGQLWVLWLEVRVEAGRRRAQIVCAPYRAEAGFGPPVRWSECPTVYPYGPSLAPLDGELALLFSDLAATEKTPDREPLFFARFDGHHFHGLRLLRSLGRHRYAKGAQLGRTFLLAYKSNARWLDYGYRFHDIALTKLGPGAGDVTTIPYADDMKYNSSPDITVYQGRAWLVYNKFEHSYGDPNDPARLYGTFLGIIEPEVAVR
ncbi:MAG: fibronectin type III domain-containing protein [Armatimonadetes bacterium]|nr:fibronectin type III domain-containing protein [Armatimonadota bacterium]